MPLSTHRSIVIVLPIIFPVKKITMPKERGTDPADLIAQSRRELGLSRQLQQDRAVAADPSLGGSGYPVWYRIKEINKHQNGEDTDCDARSIRQWNVRLLPYRHTGNMDRTKLVGFNMIALISFILAWPDATLDEMATFIYNEGGSFIQTN